MAIKYFYNIKLKDKDLLNFSSDLLTSVRKEYFDTHEKNKQKITQNNENSVSTYKFCIERDKPMKWKVVTDKKTAQECKLLPEGGYCICMYDALGAIYKKLTFSKLHTLLRVEYFEPQVAEPYCALEPRRASTGLCLLIRSADILEPVIAYALPEPPDDACEQKVSEGFNDFVAVASTDEGVLRFATKYQRELYDEFLTRCRILIDDESKPQSFLNTDESEQALKLNPKDFNIKRNLSETLDLTQAKPFSSEPLITAVDTATTAPPISTDEAIADIKTEVDNNRADTVVDESVSVQEPDTVDYAKSAPQDTHTQHSHNEDDDIMSDENLYSYATENQSEMYKIEPLLSPSDAVIETSGERYLYYGSTDGFNQRHGYGRTAMQNGRTAYEGGYLCNKRNGFGAYYYKNGGPCYIGDWKNNNRTGVGVGFDSKNGRIHTGMWNNNKPVKDGVRMEKDGTILFVKKYIEHSGETVLLSFEDDNKVVLTKYDEKGTKISEKTISINELFS